MQLLTHQESSPKLGGSHAVTGYRSAILYLAPSDVAGVGNMCTHSSHGCRSACLYRAGLAAVYRTIPASRIARTRALVSDPVSFMARLVREVAAHERAAHRAGLVPTLRLNGTTDLPWHRFECVRDGVRYPSIYRAFPSVRWYEYTKVPNYVHAMADHGVAATFSLSEDNDVHASAVLAAGGNVAAVVRGGYAALPHANANASADHASAGREWSGYPAISGDAHDLRFLDPRGVVVVLTPKGAAARADDRAARNHFFRDPSDVLRVDVAPSAPLLVASPVPGIVRALRAAGT